MFIYPVTITVTAKYNKQIHAFILAHKHSILFVTLLVN